MNRVHLAMTVGFSAVALGAAAWGFAAQRPLAPQAVWRRVIPSLVVVQSFTPHGGMVAQGSGVVVGHGLVATAAHIVDASNSWWIRQGKSSRWQAVAKRCTRESDICVLVVPNLGAPAVSLGQAPAPGSVVYSIGAPEGIEGIIAPGLYSGMREILGHWQMVSSAAISPGSSGGGLFDGDGRLVGITRAGIDTGESLGLATPASRLAILLRSKRP